MNSDIWRIGPKQFANQVYLEETTVGIISQETHLVEMTGTMKPEDLILTDKLLTKQDVNCYTTTDIEKSKDIIQSIPSTVIQTKHSVCQIS